MNPRGVHVKKNRKDSSLRERCMRLIEERPEFHTMSVLEVIRNIPNAVITGTFHETNEHYSQYLDLTRVLSKYGAEVYEGDRDAHVSCTLITHNGLDRHASARYFAYDSHTGEKRPSFYCYKCQRILTSLWYVYAMEKDYRGLNFRDTLVHIYQTYKVSPPITTWLQYDTSLLAEQETHTKANIAQIKYVLNKVRELKMADEEMYLQCLNALMDSGSGIMRVGAIFGVDIRSKTLNDSSIAHPN